MGKLRVLVVEDSSTVRAHLCRVLSADPEIEIVGETGDGQDAIEKCVALRPDAISLDMILPTISGLAVTEYVMAYCPTPILIVSSSTNRGELFRTYDALAAGAVDVLDKPQGDDTDEAWARRFPWFHPLSRCRPTGARTSSSRWALRPADRARSCG